MNIKSRMKKENGSMTVYVSIVLLSMLIMLSAIFLISTSERKQQLLVVMKVKETYEADNSKAAEIYEYLISK